MVVGGNLTVGARHARRRREAQQGGIQVAALSTSREIPTQGIDRRLFSFAVGNKRDSVLLPSMKLITAALSVPHRMTLLWLLFFCPLKNTR